MKYCFTYRLIYLLKNKFIFVLLTEFKEAWKRTYYFKITYYLRFHHKFITYISGRNDEIPIQIFIIYCCGYSCFYLLLFTSIYNNAKWIEGLWQRLLKLCKLCQCNIKNDRPQTNFFHTKIPTRAVPTSLRKTLL